MRKTKVICCLVAMLATVACMILPVIGTNGFFTEFRLPYSQAVYSRLLGGQLVGPIFTLAFLGFLLLSIARNIDFPWWITALGLIGPIYSRHAVGSCSHDFSHTVFSECSETYGDVIGWLCVVSGIALIAISILMRADQNRHRSTQAKP